MKKNFVKVLTLATLLSTFYPLTSFAGEWKSDNNGWWYQNDDGSYPKNTWQWIDGNKDGISESYYFNENGSQLKTIEGGYPSSGTFADCTALTSIEIPASVETIEAAAFKGCSSLATVTFEKGSQLKTIGGGGSSYYGAFGQLKNLMTVDMSACTQVKTIGESAFDGDSELRLFKIGTETPPTCGRDAFSGINPYSVLKVPSGCADAYKAKSGWNNFASITGLDE